MAVVIKRADGGISVMRLIPAGVRRKSDGKEFIVADKIERRGDVFVANVVAVEPTALENLPGDVAAAAINIVKVAEVSARKAFGIARMFEPPVPIFDVIYTPQHEGFKASFDTAMMDEAPNEDWEFIWPDIDAEVEKWKGPTKQEVEDAGGEWSDDMNREQYISHHVVPWSDIPEDKMARAEWAKALI